MSKPIVTVFGGGGFIGRYVVRLLAKDGWIVRVAQRRPNDALFLKPAGEIGQINLVTANIRNIQSVEQAVEGAEAIINLVGILAPSGKQRFKTIHSEGAAFIAQMAAKHKIKRFVHVSAIGADPHSLSRYARSKAEGEGHIWRHFPNATILRPSIVIGAEDQFFNRFARMTRYSPFLPLIGGGRTKFQPTYVEDVALAILRTLTVSGVEGKIFELGGPSCFLFKDLMRRLLDEIEVKRYLLPIPYFIAFPLAFFLQMFPGAPLTLDQVRLLRKDNIVNENYPGYAALGITPQALTPTLLSYLSLYRKPRSQEQK